MIKDTSNFIQKVITYHKTCQYRHDHFLAVKSKNVDSIYIQINTMLKKEIKANRLRVIPIVKTVIFCGRQSIALRGHRDSEMLLNANENINEPEYNYGNFRQLLRFRIDAGDEYLESFNFLRKKCNISELENTK